jgi:hypothetical protein
MRVKTIKNIYEQRHETLTLPGAWGEVLGKPEAHGAWLIWGAEKAGKTWFAVHLADALSRHDKVLYVSAEEGTGLAFVDTCRKAGLSAGNRNLQIVEYLSIDELEEKLNKRRSARVVFIDNMTIYADELRNGVLRRVMQRHNKRLFVFLAHEDRKSPYTATAKLVRKLAKVIIYVKGYTCTVSGRVPGGLLSIDQERSELYKFQFKTHDNNEQE